MSGQERIIEIDEVPYIELSRAAERLGLSKKEMIELLTDQDLLSAVRTKSGLSLGTRLSRKTPLLVEKVTIENLARKYSEN